MTANTPSEELVRFCALLEADPELQRQVQAASNPHQIIDVAQAVDCPISVLELRIWSRELSADWFPWATMGHAWRRAFFQRRPGLAS